MTSWRRSASVPDEPPLSSPGLEPVPVAVVSPYPATRAGLRVLLESAPAITVVAEARSLAELAESLLTDVVIVADPAGAVGAQPAGEDAPALVVLGPPEARLLASISARPRAFLPAESDAAELAAAVHAVRAGLVAVHPAFLGRLLGGGDVLPGGDTGADGPTEELTPREREVLALLAEGLPNKTIARRLGISDHTVKFHVGAVLGKLGASSRTEAVRIGLRRGLIAL